MHGRTDLDHRIAALAFRQHGVIGRSQLRELGLTDDAIDGRVKAGRLLRVFRGVFAVGHTRLSREGRWMASTLAGGRRAALSHGDAAALWELAPARGALIHVSTPSRSGRIPEPGRIRLHRVGTLAAGEVTRRDGIPRHDAGPDAARPGLGAASASARGCHRAG